jgi:hypothetical protein
MTLEKSARETLRYLFAEFLKAPTVVYSITQVTKRLKIDATILSDYLLEKGWIRERWIYPDETVGCRITIKGIEEVDKAYVREKLGLLIGSLVDAGGSKGLLEILEYNLKEYSISLDLVKQLETMQFVRLLHPKDGIIIELTDLGRQFYERHGRAFLTLMTY